MAKSSKKEEKDTKSAAKDVKKKEADTSTHAAQQKVAEQKAPKNSSKKTRTETDLLGSLEVPADAYYGVHTAAWSRSKRRLPWQTVAFTCCLRRRPKPSSGLVTRSWKRAAAWTSSHWTFSRVVLVPR